MDLITLLKVRTHIIQLSFCSLCPQPSHLGSHNCKGTQLITQLWLDDCHSMCHLQCRHCLQLLLYLTPASVSLLLVSAWCTNPTHHFRWSSSSCFSRGWPYRPLSWPQQISPRPATNSGKIVNLESLSTVMTTHYEPWIFFQNWFIFHCSKRSYRPTHK